jgi:hypothetical protein
MSGTNTSGSRPPTRVPLTRCYACRTILDPSIPGGTTTSPTNLIIHDSFYQYVVWDLCRDCGNRMFNAVWTELRKIDNEGGGRTQTEPSESDPFRGLTN